MTDTGLKPGDQVRIKSGPFASFPGTVESVSEGGLFVRVVVEVFGRATPLELQYSDVEKFEGRLPPLSSNN